MRIALLVCVAALGGCRKKFENKRVDNLDFKSFTVAVPLGWNEVTDPSILEKAVHGSHTLMLESPPTGFAPSIYIQEVVIGAGEQLMIANATAETCRDTFLKPMAEASKATPGSARSAEHGAFKGCDVEMTFPSTAQATRSIFFSNGKLSVTIVCNRDKDGAPEVDAACITIANAITPKP